MYNACICICVYICIYQRRNTYSSTLISLFHHTFPSPHYPRKLSSFINRNTYVLPQAHITSIPVHPIQESQSFQHSSSAELVLTKKDVCLRPHWKSGTLRPSIVHYALSLDLMSFLLILRQCAVQCCALFVFISWLSLFGLDLFTS